MNWVFWVLILIVIALVWVTCTGAWTKLGDWIDMIKDNAKNELKENDNERK